MQNVRKPMMNSKAPKFYLDLRSHLTNPRQFTCPSGDDDEGGDDEDDDDDDDGDDDDDDDNGDDLVSKVFTRPNG